jgi:hypothetical protein
MAVPPGSLGDVDIRTECRVGQRVSLKLVVIFGGDTPEHEVSLAGARAVLTHAAALGWDVLPVGVTRDGRWLVGPAALSRLWLQADPRAIRDSPVLRKSTARSPSRLRSSRRRRSGSLVARYSPGSTCSSTSALGSF